ncbi:MAG: ABC transporter ATP-binding protein [Bdellovibrionales bacterium]|nr:ABC transporter ATP-binding protein [Bdellovibrionales bacterium]
MLTVQKVSKQFTRHVLRDVSFTRELGSVTLLLGANGSGKTTLLRILAHLMCSNSGTVHFNGNTIQATQISFVGHQTMLYDELSPRENLELFLSLRGIQYDLNIAFDEWKLKDRDVRVKDLSQGNKVKVSLIRAFASDAPLLFLDEPSSSLDSVATELLLSKITQRAQAGAITIISTHDLERLSEIGSSALLLHGGYVAADSSADEQTKEAVITEYHKHNR